MHGAAINRIDIAADAGLLASVSDDKTLRLWNLGDGSAAATVRVPVGSGNEGKLFAVAVQPQGKLVAVGGWTGAQWENGYYFYLIDRTTGRLFGRVGGANFSSINHLAFSRDGRLLAVAFAASGVKVFDMKANKQVFQDDGFKDAVTWAEFSPDGRLAVASLDGTVRLYGTDFKPQASLRTTGHKPFSVAFADDGEWLAVGYLDGSRVTLHGGRDLAQRGEFTAPKGRTGSLSVVAFSGGALYAGGTLGSSNGARSVLRWSPGGGVPTDIPVGTDTVVDLRPLPGGGVAFATAEPSWGRIEANGSVRIGQQRGFADLRDGYRESFRLSPDGSVISFGLAQGGRKPVTFNLLQRSLTTGNLNGGWGSVAPQQDSASLKPSGWLNGREPKINGRPLRLEDNEVARSVAVSPSGSLWLMGTDFYLRAYDGDRLVWKVPAPSTVWSVNLSVSGDVAVAGMGDGTVRWYGLRDGRERVSLFAHADGKRWIAWTPEGFFDHSPGGDSLFGYLLNKAKAREADFIDAAQLYRPFFRRDLVVKKFQGGGEAEIASQLAKIGDPRAVLGKGLPPKIDVLEYCVSGECRPIEDTVTRGTTKATRAIETKAPEVVLKIKREDRGGGLGQLIVRRNGANVAAAGETRSVPTQGGSVDEVRLALQPGENEVSLSVTNTSGEIEANALEQLTVRIKLAADESRLPRLHVLAIGISGYQLKDLTLANAANDARAISRLMQDADHKLYREVIVTTMIDKDATRAGIAAAFARLATEVAPDDRVLVFFAGHGIALDGRYYFIPYDLPQQSAEAIGKAGFSQQQLSEMMARMKASRVMLMVDTCFAGSIDVDEIGRRARDQTWVESLSKATGRFTLVGTTNEQEALDGLNGNGVFTGVLLKALHGDADQSIAGNRDGKVNVYELAQYTLTRVPEAVRQVDPNHKQVPTFHFTGSDFFDIRADD